MRDERMFWALMVSSESIGSLCFGYYHHGDFAIRLHRKYTNWFRFRTFKLKPEAYVPLGWMNVIWETYKHFQGSLHLPNSWKQFIMGIIFIRTFPFNFTTVTRVGFGLEWSNRFISEVSNQNQKPVFLLVGRVWYERKTNILKIHCILQICRSNSLWILFIYWSFSWSPTL